MSEIEPQFKTLEFVNQYEDKFKLRDLNCFLRGWAILMGSFEIKYSDYFLFLETFYKIYMLDKSYYLDYANEFNEFEHCYDKNLKSLFGISIRRINCIDELDFIGNIEEQINLGRPVVVPINLYYLNYSKNYRSKVHYHYMLLKGYDRLKERFIILDDIHISEDDNTKYKDFYLNYFEMYNGYAIR